MKKISVINRNLLGILLSISRIKTSFTISLNNRLSIRFINMIHTRIMHL